MSNYPLENTSNEVKKNAAGEAEKNGNSNAVKSETFEQKRQKAEVVKTRVKADISSRSIKKENR